MEITLSEKLKLFAGPGSGDDLNVSDVRGACAAINDMIVALKTHAANTRISCSLKDVAVVQTLFTHGVDLAIESNRRRYEGATITCVIQFLEWCRRQLTGGGLQKRLLNDFCYDFANTGILGDEFFRGKCWRTNTPHSLVEYVSLKSLLERGAACEGLSQDLFVTFGLRQLLEAKFRRLLGIDIIDPMPKIPHDVVPGIVGNYEDKFRCSKNKRIAFSDVMHIYRWTDVSIHTMSVGAVWMAWKALDVCDFLFLNAASEKRKATPFLGTVEFDRSVLECMREDFRRWLLGHCFRPRMPNEYRVFWSSPEAIVVDNETKNLVEIEASREVIRGLGKITVLRRPSLMIVMKKWPTGDVGCRLARIIRIVGERGVSVTVCLNDAAKAGVGTVGLLDSKWYQIDIAAGIVDVAAELRKVIEQRKISTVVDFMAGKTFKKALKAVKSEEPGVSFHSVVSRITFRLDVEDEPMSGGEQDEPLQWLSVMVNDAAHSPLAERSIGL